MDHTSATSLDRYLIGPELGRGGMGIVYRAEDAVLKRPVALKMLSAQLTHDDDFRSRFGREAALLAQLDSPHVVQIYDYGQQDDTLYMVTQYVEGGDLAQLLKREGPLPPPAAVAVMLQLCDGLSSAHDLGVVHRDVKPSNVLVRRRGDRLSTYLCDFGIAATAESEHTRAGMVVGSPAYMAPERHEGARPDVRGDVYSLGCLFWALLTGSPPYLGTPTQMLYAHLSAAPPQFAGDGPEVRSLNAILCRALAKVADERYPDAAALARDLEHLDPSALPETMQSLTPKDDHPTVVSPWASDVTMFGEHTAIVDALGAPTLFEHRQTAAPAFSKDDIEVIEAEILSAGARSAMNFSVYIGHSEPPPEEYARRLHATLSQPADSVLLMIDPAARVFQIVTGSHLRGLLPDAFVQGIADQMKGRFGQGQMCEGLVQGVRALAVSRT